jgi:cytochrome P450
MAESDGKDVVNDTLQTYIEAKYEDGRHLPDGHIVGMLIGLLFAGQHTSSITTSWATMLLLKVFTMFRSLFRLFC